MKSNSARRNTKHACNFSLILLKPCNFLYKMQLKRDNDFNWVVFTRLKQIILFSSGIFAMMTFSNDCTINFRCLTRYVYLAGKLRTQQWPNNNLVTVTVTAMKFTPSINTRDSVKEAIRFSDLAHNSVLPFTMFTNGTIERVFVLLQRVKTIALSPEEQVRKTIGSYSPKQ